MAVLRRQIGKLTKGFLGDRQEWWLLCYDVENSDFFVEHRWCHIMNDRLLEESSQGKVRVVLESYSGPGWDLIDEAMDEIFAEAGHDQTD